MAHLVDELRGEKRLDLPGGSRQQEGGEVGGDPLLADIEAAEAVGRVLLRVGGRLDPVLLVDREVELVRLPVLALPERVELLVAHQATLGPLGAAVLGARVAWAGSVRRNLRAPGSGSLRLHAALALLAF